jgi:peptidoglycan/xylan/chitin deacetylase (PgdA/CDA1 family)
MSVAPLTPTATPHLSILMYHQVGFFPRPAAHRAVFCHVDRFKAQMAYLKAMNFSVLSLEQARACLFEGKPLPGKSVVLTFDDGYENFREHAWPAMQKHGFPATVFLVSDLLGKTSSWLGSEFADHPPLMSASTVRQLASEGVNFGSHACSHPRLSRLDDAQMRREVFDSKSRLEDVLGNEVPDFCYPYGDYNARTIELVQEAGYRTGLTCIKGPANTAYNPLEIPRKAISYGDNLIGFAWKLHVKNKRKG